MQVAMWRRRGKRKEQRRERSGALKYSCNNNMGYGIWITWLGAGRRKWQSGARRGMPKSEPRSRSRLRLTCGNLRSQRIQEEEKVHP